MPSFDSIPEFTRFLSTRRVVVREAEERGLKSAGRLLVETAKDLIGTEDPSWPPLADATVEEKERLGYVSQVSETDPLLRTGSLRASIVTQSQVTTLGRGAVEIGSNDPVAEWQEFGTRTIPPRPFIGTALFREGEAAAHRVLNHEMGALMGKSGPLVPIQLGPHEPTG